MKNLKRFLQPSMYPYPPCFMEGYGGFMEGSKANSSLNMEGMETMDTSKTYLRNILGNEYPNLWKRGLIQQRVRARANHACEECGMVFNEGTNFAATETNRWGKPLIGTCHHIDGNRMNNLKRNLVYLCQRCHLRLHGSHWKPGNSLLECWSGRPPLWITDRNLDYHILPRLFE